MGNYIADTPNSPVYTEEQFRRFEGNPASAIDVAGQYFSTNISASNIFSYPFYIRLKYKLYTARLRENGAILGAGSIGVSLVSITSTTITHPWGSFSFSSGTSIHTLEITSRTSDTYDIFVDGTHYATGSLTSLPSIGTLLVGGAYYSSRAVGYRANVDVYELVIDYSYTHRHYIPCVNGNNVRGFYDIIARNFYPGADNAFSTYGNTQVNTYIPGFFNGRVGLGRYQKNSYLGTALFSLTSSFSNNYTYLNASAADIKNLLQYNDSFSTIGLSFMNYNIGRWNGEGYDDVTSTYLAPILNLDGSISIRAKSSGAFLTGSCLLTLNDLSWIDNKTADDFIYIGQGEELFNPVKIPNISLEKNLYYNMIIDDNESPQVGIVRVYNPTNMWLDFYIYANVDDSDSTSWYNEGRIILGPGKWDELQVESEDGYNIVYAAAEVDFDSLETNSKFKEVNFEFYGG